MQHNHIPLKFHRVLVIFLAAITRKVEDVRQRAVNFNFVDCFMVQLQLNVQLRIGRGSGNRFEVVERLVSEKWPFVDCFMVQLQLNVQLRIGGGSAQWEPIWSRWTFRIGKMAVNGPKVTCGRSPEAACCFPFCCCCCAKLPLRVGDFRKKVKCVSRDSFKFECLSLNFT